jgi:cobalt/nickel transport system permease protein
MHMPDGVLDPTMLVATGAASAGALAWSMRELRHGKPRLGFALGGAAGILIAHLADVPLYGTYTAHLMGGTLLAIAIGPWLATLTMASALALEAFLWHDGGTATLGANVFVMAIVGIAVGYGAYRGILALASRLRQDSEEPSAWTKTSAAAAGAWLSVMASALTLFALVSIGGATAAGTVAEAPGAATGDLLLWYAAWGLLEATLTGVAVAAGLAWHRSVARIEDVTRIEEAIQKESAAELSQRVPVQSR